MFSELNFFFYEKFKIIIIIIICKSAVNCRTVTFAPPCYYLKMYLFTFLI